MTAKGSVYIFLVESHLVSDSTASGDVGTSLAFGERAVDSD
jgi:hypothetical protein